MLGNTNEVALAQDAGINGASHFFPFARGASNEQHILTTDIEKKITQQTNERSMLLNEPVRTYSSRSL